MRMMSEITNLAKILQFLGNGRTEAMPYKNPEHKRQWERKASGRTQRQEKEIYVKTLDPSLWV